MSPEYLHDDSDNNNISVYNRGGASGVGSLDSLACDGSPRQPEDVSTVTGQRHLQEQERMDPTVDADP